MEYSSDETEQDVDEMLNADKYEVNADTFASFTIHLLGIEVEEGSWGQAAAGNDRNWWDAWTGVAWRGEPKGTIPQNNLSSKISHIAYVVYQNKGELQKLSKLIWKNIIFTSSFLVHESMSPWFCGAKFALLYIFEQIPLFRGSI